jgi:hypothetical protein
MYVLRLSVGGVSLRYHFYVAGHGFEIQFVISEILRYDLWNIIYWPVSKIEETHKQILNESYLCSTSGISGVSEYKKKKTYSKQLEADNIRDYNSKIKDHNVFIKLKQIHLIDIKHFLNWLNLKKSINPYYSVNRLTETIRPTSLSWF